MAGDINALFPRYLFICLQSEEDSAAPIRSTRGVIDLMRCGNRPRVLPSGFVEIMSKQIKDRAHVNESQIFARGD